MEQRWKRGRREGEGLENSPLAGASGSVNDGFALLNFAEAGSVLEQQIIVGGRVKAANVDILVALDAVLEALVKSLTLLRGSENSGDGRRDSRVLLDEGTKLSLGNALGLRIDRTNHSGNSKLLRRRSGVARAVRRDDAWSVVAVTHGSEEGSARSRLGRGGRVGSATVVQARDVSQATTVNSVIVGGRATGSVGNHVRIVATRNATLRDEVATSDGNTVGVGGLGHAHVGRLSVATVAGVDDRGVSRHVAARRHGNWSSALRNVIIRQAERVEGTDKTTKAVVVGDWVVHATSSSVVSSLSSDISRAYALASLIVVVRGHDGRIVVRHFLQSKLSALDSLQTWCIIGMIEWEDVIENK